MKANQKFLRGDDAVSPVIAVILMVAITVVLAATVYVWVSGFGSSTSSAQKSIALTSANALQSNSTGSWKNYTIASSTTGMKFSDFSVTIAGASLSCYADENQGNAGAGRIAYRIWHGGSVLACVGTGAPTSSVTAGDVLEIYKDSTTSLSGSQLRLLDTSANAVMASLTIG